MDALPSADDRRTRASGVVRAALRLLGGADLADAISDLSGLSRRRIRSLVSAAGDRLRSDLGPEPGPDPHFGDAVEALVVRAFVAASTIPTPHDQHRLVVHALLGADELATLVAGSLSAEEVAGEFWSDEELGYFNALVTVVAELTCGFYLEDAQARGYATAIGVGDLMRRSRVQELRLADIGEQLSDLQAQTKDPDWVLTGGSARLVRVHVDDTCAGLPHIRRCAQWVRWVLDEQGFRVHSDPAGVADELLVVVSAVGAPVPEGGSTGRILRVQFEQDGTMLLGQAVRDSRTAAVRLREAVDPLVDGRRRAALERLTYDESTTLPRLRRLSDQALREAATVGLRRYDDPQSTTGLYVRRDLEDLVLDAMDQEALVVVSGEAGAGKTSILWGLVQRLVEELPARDVYFIKASYLVGGPDVEPLVTGAALADAIRSRARERETVVLVDTADLLVNDPRTFDALMDLISAVQESGGRVVVTSRPAEANTITAGRDTPFVLRPFSTEPGRDGLESEFARAVRTHALAYCSVPGDSGQLADQLLTAAIRGTPLGGMARLPLSLRMLFELYAPGLVPAQVSATALFDRYWNDRVISDQRSHTAASQEAGDVRDLSDVCLALASIMLSAGLPEARIHAWSTAPAATDGAATDIEVLCRRGVGSVSTDGVFTFFHQAFFEYAAARRLVEVPGGLSVLLARARERPDDYFLAPVAEQAWVLACQRGDRSREAHEVAVAYLDESRLDLVRQALRVLAQSAVPVDVADRMCELFADLDMDVVKEYFRLLPRPLTPWQHADSRLLAVVSSRDHDGRTPMHAVLDVLVRLALSAPRSAIDALNHVMSESERDLMDDHLIDQVSTRALVAALCREDAAWVLGLLDHVGVGRRVATSPAALARMFDVVRTVDAPDTEAVRAWCDGVCEDRQSVAVLLHALKEIHLRALRARPLTTPVERLRADLLDLVETDHPSCALVASAWAQVEMIAEMPHDLADQLLSELFRHHAPRLHEHVHHGWLLGPVNQSSRLRHRIGLQLAAGLPASRRRPTDPSARWADSIRRTLAREEVDPTAVVEIVETCCGSLAGLSQEKLWLDDDHLLWVLLLAANAGAPAAVDVLDRWRVGDIDVDDRRARIVIQQGQQISEPGPGIDGVVAFLADRRAWVDLRLMHARMALPWTAARCDRVVSSLLVDATHRDPLVAAKALDLLLAMTRDGTLAYPAWADLESVKVASSRRNTVTLAQLMVDGLVHGSYDAAGVVTRLTEWMVSQPDRDLRLQLVRARSASGPAESISRTLELAFEEPVDSSLVVALAGYLNRDPTIGPEIATLDAVTTILSVGRRLTEDHVSPRTCRDVSGAWRDVMGRVLNRADDRLLVEVVEALPDLAPTYGQTVLSHLPARRGRDIRAALQELRDDPRTSAAILRLAHATLGLAAPNMSEGWPELERVVFELSTGSASS